MAATKVIPAPCASFLSVLPSCVESDVNNNVSQPHDEEVYGYADIPRADDRVLLPHDLYENIDYSGNKSASARDSRDKSERNNQHSLYATVVPRSKRPIRGQYPGHVTCPDQSEARVLEGKPSHRVSDDDKGGVINGDTDGGVGGVRLAPVSSENRAAQMTSLSSISIQRSDLGADILSGILSNEGVRLDNEDNDMQQTPLAEFLARYSSELSAAGPLSSIPEAGTNGNLQNHRRNNHEIDSQQIRQKIRREFARLQRVRKSKILQHGKKIQKSASGSSTKFLLPPVCGKSPPCDCPEDRLYASKLRQRILTKISTLRRKHLRLRVIFNNQAVTNVNPGQNWNKSAQKYFKPNNPPELPLVGSSNHWVIWL